MLVVDDEPTIRMVIQQVLREYGYATLEAEDGVQAMRILQSAQRIDLLVTDVGLPGGVNGRQLADAGRTAAARAARCCSSPAMRSMPCSGAARWSRASTS